MQEETIKATVARTISLRSGIEIKPEFIIKLPDDGRPYSRALPHWDVYAARAGEHTVLAYVYANGYIGLRIF